MLFRNCVAEAGGVERFRVIINDVSQALSDEQVPVAVIRLSFMIRVPANNLLKTKSIRDGLSVTTINTQLSKNGLSPIYQLLGAAEAIGPATVRRRFARVATTSLHLSQGAFAPRSTRSIFAQLWESRCALSAYRHTLTRCRRANLHKTANATPATQDPTVGRILAASTAQRVAKGSTSNSRVILSVYRVV